MSQDGDGAGGSAGDAETLLARERDVVERSMRDFAESATAMAASSLRMQMLMLEQMREMMDDFNRMLGEPTRSDETEDTPGGGAEPAPGKTE